MHIDTPPEKFFKWVYGCISQNTVTISIFVFVISAIIVVSISFIYRDYNTTGFIQNLRVEAHGMLFDVLVIGVFILFLNKLAEKRIENQRYLDEIADFRGWDSDEAMFRIAGNIKRLNRKGYKGIINLTACHLQYMNLSGVNLKEANLQRSNLKGTSLPLAILERSDLQEANLQKADLKKADLKKANLRGADLKGANLSGADLEGTNLHYANLEGTDLIGVKNLSIFQLLIVNTLYKAKLDPEIMKQVKAKCPHFLEVPKV